ncbi:FepA family TonB-dependent siderophore receptor [Neomegalonema sp.]|uniref:FepA family TonB-dependent siderophore receptor n=1 Tax=Neomegalonema sp. TaxID=2039713 RepID=UPI002601B250|nr:FepA family TonB-dependent siderophore receptor [Neomegalonema sp.]MDD2868406.1 FepA family TonB-dependent siderophore receptor [Neomegalonema sp.]
MRRQIASLRSATAVGALLACAVSTASAQSVVPPTYVESAEAVEAVGVFQTPSDVIVLDEIVILSAAEQLRQAPGVSVITEEDIEHAPPARDLAELIRQMPGVALTGNSSSGQRGNQRQIDLRGMGPENTMILIDGKPVMSRNAVRPGRSGERDTRGDSNWVPAELIERIEVLRGPAAARYGSGAAGGVVNIITKRPVETTASLSTYLQVPQHREEGGSRRVNAMVGGPITDRLSYRLTAGGSWTDPDDADINEEALAEETGAPVTNAPAGREGVVSYEVGGLLSYDVNDNHRLDLGLDYSRQGNRYAGDTLLSNTSDLVDALANQGAETNVMERTTLSLRHQGFYDFGSSDSYVQWEHTENERLGEGQAGSGEGMINTDTGFTTIKLDNVAAKSEFDVPLEILRPQTLTLGAEYRGEFMTDDRGNPNEDLTADAHLFAVYVEDNIHVADDLILTPGLRLDHHDSFGFNLSPSLNAAYQITDEITLKGGVARAFKAPTLYQLNPHYRYNSRGNGCPPGLGQCEVLGNPDLDAETSINKEIGIGYVGESGVQASLTYYHNDYKNRIQAGIDPVDPSLNSGLGSLNTFQWENSGPAVISGIEGSLTLPLPFVDGLVWSTNFTKPIKRENKETGQPISLIPDYTINSALRWQATEDLGLTFSATLYGDIEARTIDVRGEPIANPAPPRDAYALFGVSADYKVNENASVVAGVSNLFDERLFRTEGNNGASTYNEPGRAFYIALRAGF